MYSENEQVTVLQKMRHTAPFSSKMEGALETETYFTTIFNYQSKNAFLAEDTSGISDARAVVS